MPDPDDVVAYPVFASKEAFMVYLRTVGESCLPNYFDLERRLANTDTDNWTADSTFDPND